MALVGALAASTASASAAPEDRVRAQPGLERAVMREMNAVRVTRGLKPLRGKTSLKRAARKHSGYLARLGRLDHDSAGGKPFWTRLVRAGYPRNSRMGENLALVGGCGRPAGYVQLQRKARKAANSSEAKRVVRIWLKSPGHRANLLNPRFRFAGAGVVSDGACNATMYTVDYGG